jgi:hypothetical protein
VSKNKIEGQRKWSKIRDKFKINCENEREKGKGKRKRQLKSE